ncbi:MAG TPA: SRPBCC domain-containing protein [Vicinamibacterales bacterium]|nr:SRPBCC domain-containing protein [Vicinamibacterales bacterium]
MSREIRKEVLIDAPPDVVWRALTDAEQLTQWFPVDARVEPGQGGSIWLSWGAGMEGTAPITAWEPTRRFQWTEDRGPVKLAIDFHLEARGGKTLVRLVQSGFGDGASWDDEFHMLEGGWSYFLAHLAWYLQRHRNTRRHLISFRERVPLSRTEALSRLIGPQGLFVQGALSAAGPGEAFRDTTATGNSISGTVVSKSAGTGQMSLTIGEMNDAILFLEMEPDPNGTRAGFWLSTYGLDPARLIATGQLYEKLYRQALGLPAA